MKRAYHIRWTGCGCVTNISRRQFRHPAATAEKSESEASAVTKANCFEGTATTRKYGRNAHALCRWIYRRSPEEETRRLRPHGEKSRQDLARIWCSGLSRMGRRGRQSRQTHLVPAQRQAEAGRNRGVFLDRLQIARATRQDQRQGDGRRAAQVHDGSEVAAVRCQADDLWRVRGPGEGLGLKPKPSVATGCVPQRGIQTAADNWSPLLDGHAAGA